MFQLSERYRILTTNKKSIEYKIDHDPVVQRLFQKQFNCHVMMNSTIGTNGNIYYTNSDQFKQLCAERSNHLKELVERVREIREEAKKKEL